MERFVKGDVIVIPFPFSDLTSSKKRPALVLSDFAGDDVILCQITSQYTKDNFAVAIADSDFISGSLHKTSNIRPNRIFAADKKLIERKIGSLKPYVYDRVVEKLCTLIK
jgi:mRNA interferase MazF